MFRMRSAAVVVAATATLASVGMAGTAFACPPKQQLSASASCGDSGPVITIANSSHEDVSYRVTSANHPDADYSGDARGADDSKLTRTNVDLDDSSAGDVWKVDYDHGARADWVRVASCGGHEAGHGPRHCSCTATPSGDDSQGDDSHGGESQGGDSTPVSDTSSAPSPSASAPAQPLAAASQPALAHTGADDTTLIAGGAALLLVVGGGAVFVTRRARRQH